MRRAFAPFLLFGFTFIFAIQSQTKQEVLLRYKYVPGETLKYKETTTIHQQGEYIREWVLTTEELSSNRTEKTYADSSADVIMAIEKTESRLFNEKVPSPRETLEGVPILLRKAASGKILEMQPLEDVSSKKRKMIDELKVQSQIGEGLPDRPLKRGEQWERSSAVSYDLGERRIELLRKVSMKFLGFDTFGGAKCAVVTMNIEISGTITTQFEEVPVKGKGIGELLFDPARGQLLKQWMQYESTATITEAKGPMELKTEVVGNMELVQ
jgi:hypothetical protein